MFTTRIQYIKNKYDVKVGFARISLKIAPVRNFISVQAVVPEIYTSNFFLFGVLKNSKVAMATISITWRQLLIGNICYKLLRKFSVGSDFVSAYINGK